MEILKKMFDQKYKTACNYLETAGLKKMEDATIVTNGKRKAVLGENSIIFIHGKRNEEMSYDSFIELNEKYSEICKLLEQKEFIKKRKPFGVDVYEYKNNRYNNRDIKFLVGKRNVKIMFGGYKDNLTYDQAISVLGSY